MVQIPKELRLRSGCSTGHTSHLAVSVDGVTRADEGRGMRYPWSRSGKFMLPKLKRSPFYFFQFVSVNALWLADISANELDGRSLLEDERNGLK